RPGASFVIFKPDQSTSSTNGPHCRARGSAPEVNTPHQGALSGAVDNNLPLRSFAGAGGARTYWVFMPESRSKPSRSRYRPAPRTADSVADLSRLNASNPIGRCNKRYVLRRIIAMNNDRHALREKKVSYKTMYERDRELHLFFDTLWSLPQWVAVDPRSLRPK